MSTATDRPRRADARRNRERVLTAAAAAFAEGGLDAQMEDIARRAGVGVGTVYRHFPTKEALVEALAEQYFQRVAATIEEAVARDGDGWEVFVDAIRRAATAAAEDVAWCEIIAGHPSAVHAAAQGQDRLAAATAALIGRAKADGGLRADATVGDIRTIMCGFGHVAAAQHAGAAMDWRRYLQIALDGLRAR